MSRWIRANQFTFKKTGSYYVTHITVAAMVAYAVTGNLAAALTLSFLEPTVQAVVYFFHERAWSSAGRRDGTVGPSADAAAAGAGG
jgi:uncharacterized membrane protein